MELYQTLIALALLIRSIGIGKILQIVLLKKLFPEATIKDVESFIDKTKTKINLPKLLKR